MTIKVSTWASCSVIRGHSTAMMSPKKPTHAEFIWSYANGCSNFVFLYEVYEKCGTSGSIIVWCVYIYADCPIRTFHRSRWWQIAQKLCQSIKNHDSYPRHLFNSDLKEKQNPGNGSWLFRYIQVEVFEGQLAACVIPNPYYYCLPLFQEILSVGASFAVCVSSLDLNLCSSFSPSSRPNCSDSFCINRAASSGGSSSGGEFITGELVIFFRTLTGK